MLSRVASLSAAKRIATSFRAVSSVRFATTYYSEDHEWVTVDGNTATVGITDFAQKALGDVVYVGLPEVDTETDIGDPIASVESVKAASDVYSPVSGTISEINTELDDDPALVNASAEDKAWFFKIDMSTPSELDDLMDKEAYDKLCAEQAD